MPGLVLLILAALFLGLCGLAALFWSLRNGQYEDLEGAGMRILIKDENDDPV